jgi:hypothetical protein
MAAIGASGLLMDKVKITTYSAADSAAAAKPTVAEAVETWRPSARPSR